MKRKEESAKAELHLNIMKTKIITIKAIHNCKEGDENVEIVKDFDYFDSVTNTNGDYSPEIKKRLSPGWVA